MLKACDRMAEKRKRGIKWGKYMDLLLRKKVCSWTPLWGMSLVHPRLSCFCVCLRTISLLFRQQPYPVHRVELILQSREEVKRFSSNFSRILSYFFSVIEENIQWQSNNKLILFRFFYKLFSKQVQQKRVQYLDRAILNFYQDPRIV